MHCKIHYETGLFLRVQRPQLCMSVCVYTVIAAEDTGLMGAPTEHQTVPYSLALPLCLPSVSSPFVCFSLHLFHLCTVLQAASLSSVYSTKPHQFLLDLNDFNSLIILSQKKYFLKPVSPYFNYFLAYDILLRFTVHCTQLSMWLWELLQ